MTMMTIEAAEKEIAKVLAELETSTDVYVEEVQIENYDVTTVFSTRQQVLRLIITQVRPKPGTNWCH